jgi:hypothetical protein
LVVDPYAVLPFAFPFSASKRLPAKQQVQHGGCGFKTVKLQPRNPFNNEERLVGLRHGVANAETPVRTRYDAPNPHHVERKEYKLSRDSNQRINKI